MPTPAPARAPAAGAPSAPAVLIEPSRDTAQPRQQVAPPPMQTPSRRRPVRTEEYYDTKSQVFSALIDTIIWRRRSPIRRIWSRRAR